MPSEQRTALIAGAITSIACGWLAWWIWSAIDGASPNGHLPRDFPHAFLAPADNGHADHVRVWRGRVPPEPPVEIDGVACWPAYVCASTECIYREQHGQPWIYAHGHDPAAPADARPVGGCVPCHKAGRDPTAVQFHTTAEAERILEGIRGPIDRP